MIPNHKQFIEAIKQKNKVCLQFYSKADSGVIDLVCAPMDYGPGGGIQDGVNRYWLWDYTSNTGSPALGLLPEQVLDLRVLGEAFDPAQIKVTAPQWSIPRDWSSPSVSGTEIQTGDKLAPAGGLVNQKQPTPPAPEFCSRLTKTK
jgi:hypothetical protein